MLICYNGRDYWRWIVGIACWKSHHSSWLHALGNVTHYECGKEMRGVTAGGHLSSCYWELLEWNREPWTVDDSGGIKSSGMEATPGWLETRELPRWKSSVWKLTWVRSGVILEGCGVVEVSGRTESCGCFQRRLSIACTCFIILTGVSFLTTTQIYKQVMMNRTWLLCL